MLCCGRYEGFDERVRLGIEWDEISLGDFVLSGGEIAALAVVEAVVRLLPGVLGHEESAMHDSFMNDGQVDHPHYTRPRSFRGLEVPEVLFSGNHGEVDDWRRQRRIELTRQRQARADTARDTPSQDGQEKS